MGSSANKGPRKMRDFDLFKVLSNGSKEDIHNESIAGNVLQKLQQLAEREHKLKWNHLNRVSEADADNITDDDSEDVTSERNRGREDTDVIHEGIKDDDGGEIRPATKYDTTRTGAKNEGISLRPASRFYMTRVERKRTKQVALVFDRWTGSVFDLPSGTSKKSRCGPWADATPATSKDELEFVAQNALTENPLVVKQICIKDRIFEEQKFEKDTCSTPFKISVLFNKTSFRFDFGYEVVIIC
ncbi:hypothetical protein U1Q18_042193 [Sarracenia purpurea var. burkii]